MRSPRHCPPSQQGVALVTVLLLVMLLSVMIVAYLVRSTANRQLSKSSFSQSQVDALALSAGDIIVGDFKQEIVNGSKVVAPVPANATYSPIYQPTSGANEIPTQNWPGQPAAGQVGTIPNLIRISSTSTIAAPGVDHPASAAPSTSVSLNQRSISTSRWNRHYLVPCASGATDSTPIGSFPVPNWVFVNTQGPTVLTAPSASVTGRYAYAVYNEGGVLDMNVAGFPSNQTITQTGGKGASLAYTDLTQLNDASGKPLLTLSQIDQVVGWRNNASTQPTGTFNSFSFAASNPANYFANVVTNLTSFMSVSGLGGVSGKPWNGNSDQALLSRQELLGLQSAIGFPTAALQYMGTFSREVNAPTFFYPATGSYTNPTFHATASNDPIANSTNLNILSLHMTQAGTAPDNFSWNAGDPLVCRRFPLGRLSLVSYSATNTSTTSALYKYFGLCRTYNTSSDASQSAWLYTGSSGSTTAAANIKTLDQVALETPAREPNFFELLKAAIHSDSVGVKGGFYVNGGATNTLTGNIDLLDALPDLQILRLGANLIDQADSDSYPTVIAYNPAGTPLYAYGIEDLPYISALSFRSVPDTFWKSNFVDPGSAGRQLRDELIPVLWNPHRTINVGQDVPGAIQFYMTGKTYYTLNGGQRNGTYSSTNDSTFYGASGNSSRYNEIALTLNATDSEQNTGSIIVDTGAYPLSNFSVPSFLLKTNGVSATGAFSTTALNAGPNMPALPNHSTPIYGLMLQNPVISQARQATAADLTAGYPYFDGYASDNTKTGSTWPHHKLNPGSGGVGVNAVLRYMDAYKNWQVYDAFAGNEADPNGTIGGNYDVFGLVAGGTGNAGLYLALFNVEYFPPYYQSIALDPNWAASGGTTPNSAFAGFTAGRDGAANNIDANYSLIMKSDPRTSRFGVDGSASGLDGTTDFVRDPGPGRTQINNSTSFGYSMASYVPTSNVYGETVNAGTIYPAMWAQNAISNGPGTYCFDYSAAGAQAGIVRPGDDFWTGASGLANTTGTTATNNIYQASDARPVVLNRAFRSVGEMGYAFRDMPYKSLDMSSSVSVDAALLDFFTTDAAQTRLAAGKVDLNTRQAPVLQAVLNGSFRVGDPTGQVALGPAAAKTIANDILTATLSTPLQNKANLVTTLGKSPNNPNTTSTVFDGNNTTAVYPSIKTQREAPVRALADVGNTRTWNLLIDVIAQTGVYPSAATTLSQFAVTGERRYWLHVALDRYTGQVVDEQWEPVYE